MTTVVDKTVRIATERAQRLEQMAAACGQTEDTLIEEGLDLLFRKLDQQSMRAKMIKVAWRCCTVLEVSSWKT